jgi:hypothetical protein
MFFTLWYNDKAGGARDGTFGWIYSDGVMGVSNYYERTDQGSKVPVVYPGFNAAYGNGAPGWSVPYDVSGDTFTTLWNLAKGVGQLVQVATWNDYTEGTMIEPTNEFGYKYLTTLQKLLGVNYGQAELEIVRKLYDARKAGDSKADAASQALNNFDLVGACAQLGCKAPTPTGGGGSGSAGSGSAGSPNGTAGTPSEAGTSSNGSAGMPTNTSGGAPPATGGTATAGSDATVDNTDSEGDSHDSGGCSLRPTRPTTSSGYVAALAALLVLARRRRAPRIS